MAEGAHIRSYYSDAPSILPDLFIYLVMTYPFSLVAVLWSWHRSNCASYRRWRRGFRPHGSACSGAVVSHCPASERKSKNLPSLCFGVFIKANSLGPCSKTPPQLETLVHVSFQDAFRVIFPACLILCCHVFVREKNLPSAFERCSKP